MPFQIFEDNLVKQEANITEIGEKEATQEIRKNFNELKAGSGLIPPTIRKSGLHSVRYLT